MLTETIDFLKIQIYIPHLYYKPYGCFGEGLKEQLFHQIKQKKHKTWLSIGKSIAEYLKEPTGKKMITY